MPATKFRNILYRLALPFLAPGPGRDPILLRKGEPLRTESTFVRLIRRHHVLGSAVVIAASGKNALILTGSETPRHIPAEDTYFRVASITKMAVALGALRLEEEGKWSLDAPLARALPPAAACPELKGVTLRHLLSHTSGLNDPPDYEALMQRDIPFPEVLPGLRFAPPGESFRYSNLGFGLIGCAMEAVTGLPVSEALRRLIFVPLGLRAALDPTTIPEERIMPVTRILPWRKEDLRITALGRKPLLSPDPLRHYGHTAGSLYIDVLSLYALLRCLMDGGKPVLRGDRSLEMIQEHASYNALSPGLSYGLGMLIIRDPALSDHRILGHQGFAYGCADGAFWEEDTGNIMIMVNGGASEARDGRLGLLNSDMLRWAFRKELPQWQ